MSDHHLPDDLKRWPADPYQLLGVAPGCSPRDLRRAYTQLIRIFKPEQHPDEFRRIREAYEAALRGAEFAPLTPAEPWPERPQDDAPPAPAAPSADAELDQLWEQAIAGDAAGAYRKLVEWQERYPGRAGGLLRLYWLLALAPELDATHRPADWLFAGLWENGLSGPLWELCRRELTDDPEAALGDRCADLLHRSAASSRLIEFARWR
jgi:hypothetical protein